MDFLTLDLVKTHCRIEGYSEDPDEQRKIDETIKELQDDIIAFIKENHMKVLHEVAINMFIDGVGRIELHRSDRTIKNELANNKGNAIGAFMAIIVNEVDKLRNGESLSVTITKE